MMLERPGQRLRVHAQVWNAADGSTLFTAKHFPASYYVSAIPGL